jgi:haloalkane dehalogenase
MFREIPVCVVWGMKDWYFTPRYLNRWRLFYPQAQILEINNAGYFVLEDECVQSMMFIKNFLESSYINTEI